MDAGRFDALTKAMSRRQGRRVVLGVVAALLGGRGAAGASHSPPAPAPCGAVRWDEGQGRSRCDRAACAALGGCCHSEFGTDTCCAGGGSSFAYVCCTAEGPDDYLRVIADCGLTPGRRVCYVRRRLGQRCPVCVDPQTDQRHCGRCGHECAEGRVCRDGACVRRRARR